MTEAKVRVRGYQSRVWSSTRRLLMWGLAWMGTTALMKFGPRYFWDQGDVMTLAAVGLNLLVGVGFILATKRHIDQLDELQRKVYLNALAITVGVALIVTVPYSVMELYHLAPFHADISDLLMLMSLTFIASFLFGTWRYR